MKAKSFEVWNFKSIEYSGKILLEKMLILLGQNSSGKSSIGKSLLLLKQTFANESLQDALMLNGNLLKQGNFEDLIHLKDCSKSLKYRFCFEDYHYKCKLCNENFTFKKKLNSHFDEKHKNIKQKKKKKFERNNNDKTSDLILEYIYNEKQKEILVKQIQIKYEFYDKISNKFDIKIEFRDDVLIMIVKEENQDSVILYFIDRKKFSIGKNHLFYIILEIFSLKTAKIVNFNVDVTDDSESKKSYEERIEISIQEFLKKRKSKKQDEGNKNSISVVLFTKNSEKEEIRPIFEKNHPLPDLFSDHLSKMSEIISALLNYLQKSRYIAPLRNWPERIYFNIGGSPNSVGNKGEFTHEIIWRDVKSHNSKIVKKINKYLQFLGFNYKIIVDSFERSGLFQILVQEKKLRINISDVGFGFSQVLPILLETLIYYSESEPNLQFTKTILDLMMIGEERSSSFIFIEQPEIHLNSKIQTQLCDFFIENVNSNSSLIIETHSEYILSRLQRRVFEKKISNDDIKIYYFEKKDQKTKIKEITFDKNGNYSYWPKDFFVDDFLDTYAMFKGKLED